MIAAPLSGPLGMQPHGVKVRCFNRSGVAVTIGTVVHTSMTHAGAVLDPEQSGSPLYAFNCVRRADGKVTKTNGYVGVVTSLCGRSGDDGQEVEVQFGGVVKARVASSGLVNLPTGTRLRASAIEGAFTDDPSAIGDFNTAAVLVQPKDALSNALVDVFVLNQYWSLESIDGSTLSLNFLTGTLDSRLTFTRNTAEAYHYRDIFNENKALQTASFPATGWNNGYCSIAAVVDAPDGSLTARRINRDATGNTTYHNQLGLGLHQGTYTISAYVRNVSIPYPATGGIYNFGLFLRISGTTGLGYAGLRYYLNTNTVLPSSGEINGWTGTVTESGVVDVGNGWKRIWCTLTYTATTPGVPPTGTIHEIILSQPTSNNSVAYQYDVWGLQVCEGDKLTTFLPTTTTAEVDGQVASIGGVNLPRFEKDPATGRSLGLLMEIGATNYLLESETLTTAPWTNGGNVSVAAAPATVMAPDGTAQAFLIESTTATSGVRYAEQDVALLVANDYVISVFCKRGLFSQSPFVALGFVDVGGGNAWVTLNTDDGTTAIAQNTMAAGDGPTKISARNVGNGWWRLSYRIGPSADGTAKVRLAAATTSTQVTTVIGYSALFWGAQVELDNYMLEATSYIRTTSGTAARVGDTCFMTGANFNAWFNASEGTLFVETTRSNGASRSAVLDDTTVDNRMLLYFAEAAVSSAYGLIAQGGGVQLNQSVARTIVNGKFKERESMALAYKANDSATAYEGTVIGTDTTVVVPTVTRLGVGVDSIRQMNGNIARIKYWPYRLSNAQLAKVT